MRPRYCPVTLAAKAGWPYSVRVPHPHDMPSFYDPARRQELLDRLARLTPERTPAWGRFTAPRMVRHLIESLKLATGELVVAPRYLPLRAVTKRVAIHWIPWPRGAKTAPELLAGVPGSWDADVAQLRERLVKLPVPSETDALPEHPLFGAMSKHDWGVLLYRHVDHHLTQFGC